MWKMSRGKEHQEEKSVSNFGNHQCQQRPPIQDHVLTSGGSVSHEEHPSSSQHSEPAEMRPARKNLRRPPDSAVSGALAPSFYSVFLWAFPKVDLFLPVISYNHLKRNMTSICCNTSIHLKSFEQTQRHAIYLEHHLQC